MLKRLYWLVLAGATFLGASRTHAQGEMPAFTLGSVSAKQPPSFTGTRGWGFYHNGADAYIIVTQLGVFDSGGDGLVNSHQIGLWSPDGTVLASATVPAGSLAPLYDGYRYVAINPVFLPVRSPAGAAIIAAQYFAGDADDLLTPSPGNFNPGVQPGIGNFSFGWYGLGSGLPFPNLQTPPPSEGVPGPGFWEVNFRYTVVPEPSSVLLILLGGGALLYVRRTFHH